MTLEIVLRVTILLAAVTLARTLLRSASASSRHLLQLLGLAAALALPVLALGLPSWNLAVLPATVDSPTADELPTVAPRHTGPAIPSTPPAGPTSSDGPAQVPSSSAVGWQMRVATNLIGPVPGDEVCDDCGIDGFLLTSGSPGQASSGAAQPAQLDATVEEALTAASPANAGSWRPSTGGLLFAVWFAGFAFLAARTIAGWTRIGRRALDARPCESGPILRMVEECGQAIGVKRLPRVLISREMQIPALWGFLSPTLLLPAGAERWNENRLRAVILHELAHVRRTDGLGLLIGRAATAIYWFNPLAWTLERGARRDCERACDDAVVATGQRPSSYARQLLAFAAELPAAQPLEAAALGLVGRSQLEWRVRSILAPGSRRKMSRAGMSLVCAMVAFALLPLSTAQLAARGAEVGDDDRLVMTREDASGELNGFVPIEDTNSDAEDRGLYLLAHDDHGGHDAGRRAFERAYELHGEGKWDAAIARFQESIDDGYRVATSSYNIACGHALQGDAAQALAWIDRALEAGFDSYDLLYEDSDLDPIRERAEFRSLLDRVGDENGRHPRDRYEEALDRLRELEQDDQADSSDWAALGARLLSMRQMQPAIDALSRAVELAGGGGSTAAYNLACAYALNGDREAALNRLEQAVLAGFDSDERFENDTDLDSIRGSKRFDEIRDLHDELSMDHFRSGFHWGWNRSRSNERAWRPAIDHFTTFTGENPSIGRGWHNLAWALHASGRHAEAYDAWARADELGWNPSTTEYNLGCAAAMDGRKSVALEHLERAVAAGYASEGHMADDEDLESLRGDRAFEALLDRLHDQEVEREGREHRHHSVRSHGRAYAR